MKQLIEEKLRGKNKMRNSAEEELIKHLKKAEEEMERGEGIEADIVFKELRQKYGY